MYSVALLRELHDSAACHLIRQDGQEDVLFAVYHPSSGARRFSGLLKQLLFPEPGDRSVHGNVSFESQYVERCLREAARIGGGLVLLHSHPGYGWQGMSGDDIRAEEELAIRAHAVTELPLIGMTIGLDHVWSARVWTKSGRRKFERQMCETVRVVGDQLVVSYDEQQRPRPRVGAKQLRTVSAWGEEAQAHLARLRVGLVGAGSVGMIAGEGVAKSGIEDLVVIDYDILEMHNLDRVLFGVEADVLAMRRKAHILAEGLLLAATTENFQARPIIASVVEADGFRAALDCDVLIACVDRPWARSALNLIAMAHLIPVIDGGIYIAAKPGGGLRHADWRAHTISPGRACLECLGQFDPGLVSVERDGYLDDPKYIEGLPDDHILKRRENVFIFSLGCASLQLMQLLSLIVGPDYSEPGAQTFRYTRSTLESDHSACSPSCYYLTQIGLGDHAEISPVGFDRAAEKLRDQAETQNLAASDAGHTGWWSDLVARIVSWSPRRKA